MGFLINVIFRYMGPVIEGDSPVSKYSYLGNLDFLMYGFHQDFFII